MPLIFSSSNVIKPQKVRFQKVISWLEKLIDKEKKAQKRIRMQAGVSNQISTDPEIKQISREESIEKSGREEAVKSHAIKAEKNRQAVEDMVSNSNRILLRISSVFPWDFYPTSIVVEETRITIIHRQLFSSQVHSVDIKNISNVFVDTSILFSKLTIVSDTFAENQIIVSRLWKKEAIYIRRIIEGLRMFVNKDIDTTDYEVEELKNKLRELSTTGIVL